jgi:hypothetical protein
MIKYFFFIAIFIFSTSAMAEQIDSSSKMKKDVDIAYNLALQKVSAVGQADLQRAHKNWLTFVEKVCAPKNLKYRDIPKEKCLQNEYYRRKKNLDSAVVTTKDGLIIRRVEYFATHHEVGSKRTGAYTAEVKIAWPQIDSPVNEGQRQWNLLMTQYTTTDEKTEDHYCNTDDDYKVIYTRPDFISLQLTRWFYCQGTPHGYNREYISNRILSTNRELIADDVFKAGTGWEDAISIATWNELFSGEAIDPQYPERYKKFKHEVTRPSSWVFKHEGLGIQFSSWEFTGGAVNTPTFYLIPWEKLKPYLAEHPHFPLPPQ